MSFCNSPRTERTPGAISGNPLNGLCEKVCIQVKKVFDACLRQVQDDNVVVTLSNFRPPNPAGALTFVSCRSSTQKGVIGNLIVDRLTDRPRFARVRCNVGIPQQCIYVDAAGAEGMAQGMLNVPIDVLMCVPEQSLIPFEFEAVCSSVCPEGTIQTATLTADACITIILKIVVEAEILVPSYGYCQIPPCQEFSNQICASFFELPLYPPT